MSAFNEKIAERDRFVLRQHFRLVRNQYEFSLPDEGDEGTGEIVCYVEQARFKFKEDIRFFGDDSKEVELLRIKARQRFDPRAKYDITTGSSKELGSINGQPIGKIQKVFGKSLIRSTYKLYGPAEEEIAIAQEASMPIGLFRRIVGFIPYVDYIANWLPIPYDFEFLTPEGELLGTNRRRRWKWRDTYDIDMTPDAGRRLDRRMVLAICVGMDALQAR